MAEYTYADVIIDPEDPRVEIGKEYYFGTGPSMLLWGVLSANWAATPLVKVYKDAPSRDPFYNGSSSFQCIIRKKEPEKKWVPFDLGNEEDRAKLRGAWIRMKGYPQIEQLITSMNAEYAFIDARDDGFSAAELLHSYELIDGSPCGKLEEVE